MDFSSFNFHESLAESIESSGYKKATLIQEKAIPVIMDGKDIIASAQTGTGKTAAFLLPIIEKTIHDDNRQTLVMAPTRELAIQIDESFRLDFLFSPIEARLTIFDLLNSLQKPQIVQ